MDVDVCVGGVVTWGWMSGAAYSYVDVDEGLFVVGERGAVRIAACKVTEEKAAG